MCTATSLTVLHQFLKLTNTEFRIQQIQQTRIQNTQNTKIQTKVHVSKYRFATKQTTEVCTFLTKQQFRPQPYVHKYKIQNIKIQQILIQNTNVKKIHTHLCPKQMCKHKSLSESTSSNIACFRCANAFYPVKNLTVDIMNDR